ncbi:MAG: Flp pilus assembly protein CpaB [Bryobacteraceae bacterium]|nr:Flp pilus assembly protein CpaB [Bryobacteraceae bacterium]
MDRRFLTVLGVSLLFALVVSAIFYQFSARGKTPGPAAPPEMKDLVVAAKPLPIGVMVRPDDVKIAKVPANGFPNGAVSKVEDVIDRPVIANILLDEPIHTGRLAERGSGLGLAPVIPPGMRAVSIRVDQVVGVSGFVLPGMRVDVLLTGSPPQEDGRVTVTVLQNILVLSAGQTIEPEAKGHAINAATVTLLVTPSQAEALTLSANEGRVQLVLRNGSDQQIARTDGAAVSELYRRRQEVEKAPRPAPARTEQAAIRIPPVPARPIAPPSEVVVFRGTQRTVETVNASLPGQRGN